MEVSDVAKMRALEDENRRLKRIVADQALHIDTRRASGAAISPVRSYPGWFGETARIMRTLVHSFITPRWKHAAGPEAASEAIQDARELAFFENSQGVASPLGRRRANAFTVNCAAAVQASDLMRSGYIRSAPGCPGDDSQAAIQLSKPYSALHLPSGSSMRLLMRRSANGHSKRSGIVAIGDRLDRGTAFGIVKI